MTDIITRAAEAIERHDETHSSWSNYDIAKAALSAFLKDPAVVGLENSLANFAEMPTRQMENYACHKGICSKEECGRCGLVLKAYKALTDFQNLKQHLDDSASQNVLQCDLQSKSKQVEQ